MRLLRHFGFVLAFVTGVHPAIAQTAADSAASQALYEEGVTLLRGGNPVEACPKLEESQKLDPGSFELGIG